MIKPFLTNKVHINGEEIILKCDNETITDCSNIFPDDAKKLSWFRHSTKKLLIRMIYRNFNQLVF